MRLRRSSRSVWTRLSRAERSATCFSLLGVGLQVIHLGLEGLVLELEGAEGLLLDFLELGFDLVAFLLESGGGLLLFVELAAGLGEGAVGFLGDDLVDEVAAIGLLGFELGEEGLVGGLEGGDAVDGRLEFAGVDGGGLGGKGLAELGFEQLLLGGEAADAIVEVVELGEDLAGGGVGGWEDRGGGSGFGGRGGVGRGGSLGKGLLEAGQLFAAVADAVVDDALVPVRVAALDAAQLDLGLFVKACGGADIAGLVSLLDEVVGDDELVVGSLGTRHPGETGQDDDGAEPAEHGVEDGGCG